jgi:16S rRNA (guanine(966)-N(2))-methyltransferase RsmD
MDRVRESLFAILTPRISGCSFLDLFAGAGSVGLEALSRGAIRAAFVDSSRGCASAIRENLALMSRQADAVVVNRPWSSALSQLAEHGETFDIVFADPPYEDESVLVSVAARVVGRSLLRPGGLLVLQHTIRLALPDALDGPAIRVDSRRFGETLLSFYRLAGERTGPGVQDN